MSYLKKERSGILFEPGKTFTTTLARINQLECQSAHFEIVGFLGRGFGSEAYRAVMNGEKDVVFKPLDPGGWRRNFRDLMSRAAFGLPFPAAYFEPATIISEGWRDLLQRGVEIEACNYPALSALRFADSYGHAIVPNKVLFADVTEFVSQNPYESPIPGSKAAEDFWFKKNLLDDLVEIAKKMGARDLSRQWQTSTLIATHNAFVQGEGQERKVVVIDWRPGLPVIAPIPLSPGDVGNVLRLIAEGRPYSFDGFDLKALWQYRNNHKKDFRDLDETIERLTEAQQVCRDIFISPLEGSPVKRLKNLTQRHQVIGSAFAYEETLLPHDIAAVKKDPVDAMLHLTINSIPIIGPEIQKVLFNEKTQSHIVRLIADQSYRHGINQQAVDRWIKEGRLREDEIPSFRSSDVTVLLERPLSILPPKLHRLIADGDPSLDIAIAVGKKILSAAQVLLRRKTNQEWIKREIQEGVDRKLINDRIAEKLLAGANDPKTFPLTRDILITTLGMDLASAGLTGVLAGTGWYLENPLLTAMAVYNAPLVPKALGFGGGSIFRGFYFMARGGYDWYTNKQQGEKTHFKADLKIAGLASLAYVGNLAALMRLAIWHPELATYLVAKKVDSVVESIPVLGGRGTLTEAISHEHAYALIERFTKNSQEKKLTEKEQFDRLARLAMYLGSR